MCVVNTDGYRRRESVSACVRVCVCVLCKRLAEGVAGVESENNNVDPRKVACDSSSAVEKTK